MRLNDPLATSIFFNGQKYKMNLSYNRVLDVLEVIERKDVLEFQKLKIMMSILIVTVADQAEAQFADVSELSYPELKDFWDLIRDNYINLSKKEVVRYDLEGNPMPSLEEEDDQPVLDLKQDAKYIYASFRQIGINLFAEQNRMHWEEFQALLESLPDDTIMQKIMQIRVWKPQKGDSAKYKMQMKKLQDKYRLGEAGDIDDE